MEAWEGGIGGVVGRVEAGDEVGVQMARGGIRCAAGGCWGRERGSSGRAGVLVGVLEGAQAARRRGRGGQDGPGDDGRRSAALSHARSVDGVMRTVVFRSPRGRSCGARPTLFGKGARGHSRPSSCSGAPAMPVAEATLHRSRAEQTADGQFRDIQSSPKDVDATLTGHPTAPMPRPDSPVDASPPVSPFPRPPSPSSRRLLGLWDLSVRPRFISGARLDLCPGRRRLTWVADYAGHTSHPPKARLPHPPAIPGAPPTPSIHTCTHLQR